MALEYTLIVASQLDVETVLPVLGALPGFEVRSDWITGPGLSVYPRNADKEDKEFVQENYGFVPTLLVLFVQKKFADPTLSDQAIVAATMAILSRDREDAVLDFNGDVILLRRMEGKLYLNGEEDFWTSSILALVSLPYELKESSFLVRRTTDLLQASNS